VWIHNDFFTFLWKEEPREKSKPRAMDACTDIDASREIGSGSHTSGGVTMHVNTFARWQGNATSDQSR
jgi:hypothetical protein